MKIQKAGLGATDPVISIYINNRPPLQTYETLHKLRPLEKAELQYIVHQCSNHWRKVFNVFAKFLFALGQGTASQHESWQNYRDTTLLQSHCLGALLFSQPVFEADTGLHIIAGKTYANDLNLPFPLTWLDGYFAINVAHRCIVCPYLDYRQLTNERLEVLVSLVRSM